MNKLLSNKKQIEIEIYNDSIREDSFRLLTGYNEIYDSISVGKVYPYPQLIDSIWLLKEEKKVLKKHIQTLNYSIDSLQKLK